MLNIQRSESDGEVVFVVSGRIEPEDVVELERLVSLETKGQAIALDLGNVTLIDREAQKFLAKCRAQKIRLKNCPAYAREWLEAERG